MPACPHCSKTFITHSDLHVHKRRCEPSITVTYANQTATIHKEDKGYCCYCSHTSCPKYYQTTKGLINHAKNTGMDWIGPEKVSEIKTLYIQNSNTISQKTSSTLTALHPDSTGQSLKPQPVFVVSVFSTILFFC